MNVEEMLKNDISDSVNKIKSKLGIESLEDKLLKENQEYKEVLSKVKNKIEEKIEFCKNESKGHINHDKCDKTALFLKKILDDLKEVE